MESMRLQTLEQLSMIQEFLESLMLQLGLPPEGLERISDKTRLPHALQRIIERGVLEGLAWVAWSEYADEVDFYTAEFAMDLSRLCSRPTIRFLRYDAAGKLQEYSAWTRIAPDVWKLCPQGG